MSWTTIVLFGLCLWLFLYWRVWAIHRNVIPKDLAPWFDRLMRAYEDGASVRIRDRNKQAEFRCVLFDSKGTKSRLRLLVVPTALASRHSDSLRAICKEEGDFSTSSDVEDDGFASVGLDVRDIWAADAGARCARIVQKLLSAMEMSQETRVHISFEGRRSLERSMEGRNRLRERWKQIRGR